MSKVIAIVGLSKGYYAYYDDISNISIDLSRPTAPVYAGTDVSGLKRAIGNTLCLVSGSLTGEAVAEVEVQDKVLEKEENITGYEIKASFNDEEIGALEPVTVEDVAVEKEKEPEKTEEPQKPVSKKKRGAK